jgi:hypothetical protein
MDHMHMECSWGLNNWRSGRKSVARSASSDSTRGSVQRPWCEGCGRFRIHLTGNCESLKRRCTVSNEMAGKGIHDVWGANLDRRTAGNAEVGGQMRYLINVISPHVHRERPGYRSSQCGRRRQAGAHGVALFVQ